MKKYRYSVESQTDMGVTEVYLNDANEKELKLLKTFKYEKAAENFRNKKIIEMVNEGLDVDPR